MSWLDRAYRAAQFIAEQIGPVPYHEVTTVPHTKHMVMYDDPAGFHRILDTFLAAHPKP